MTLFDKLLSGACLHLNLKFLTEKNLKDSVSILFDTTLCVCIYIYIYIHIYIDYKSPVNVIYEFR